MNYKLNWNQKKQEFEIVSWESGEETPLTNFVGDMDGVPYFSLIENEGEAVAIRNTLNDYYMKGYFKVVRCRTCGLYFLIAGDVENWYKQQGFALPKSCKSCREAKRKENERLERFVKAVG